MPPEKKRKKPTKLTREELYRQVWQTPMTHLASRYGLSGNGLAKKCRRLKIPYPPRGFWAKKSAGKRVNITPLPEPDNDTPESVTIDPTPPPGKRPDLPKEAKDAFAKVTSTLKIKVSGRLGRAHSIIAGWRVRRKHEREEARRPECTWAYDPGPFTPSETRQHRILDALFKALERQGLKIGEDEQTNLYAQYEGIKIEFRIREKLKQVRRPLTEREMEWRRPEDRDWKQELQPTGNLVFSIKTHLPAGFKSEWIEQNGREMDGFLPEIVATFVAAGPMLVEEQRRRQEEAKLQAIAEQKRYEEEQRRKCDDNRWRRFSDIACQWRKIELARDFLAALKKTEMEIDQEIEGRTLREWLKWAEKRIHSDNPLNCGAEAIFDSVASVNEWTYRD